MDFLRSLDKHPPGPVRAALGQLGEDEQAYVCSAAPRLPTFGKLDGIEPALPMLAGLSLQPRPVGELRRFMAERGFRAALLSEDEAATVLVNAIRQHRWGQLKRPSSRAFNAWLRHAYALGQTVAPLFFIPRVMREVELTLNKMGAGSISTPEAA